MFPSIIGHRKVCEFLERSIIADRVAHAYLFLGPAQVGKMAVARAFAETLLGSGVTPSRSLESNPDVTLVGRLIEDDIMKTMISVDQVRELRERLSYSSFLPSYKIAIIDDAHTMTIEAANALLKTLEEPRGRTVIILIASDARHIPETVRSRSQLIRFGLVSDRVIDDALRKRGAHAKDAGAFVELAHGRPGVALEFLASPETFAELTIAIAERVAMRGRPLHARLRWVETTRKRWTHDDVAHEFSLWRALLRFELLEHLDSPRAALSAIKRLSTAEDALRHHGDPRLALEHFLTA